MNKLAQFIIFFLRLHHVLELILGLWRIVSPRVLSLRPFFAHLSHNISIFGHPFYTQDLSVFFLVKRFVCILSTLFSSVSFMDLNTRNKRKVLWLYDIFAIFWVISFSSITCFLFSVKVDNTSSILYHSSFYFFFFSLFFPFMKLWRNVSKLMLLPITSGGETML